MEIFHWIVIGIALFFLIVILILVGIMMRNNLNNKIVFPPVQETCPNLWINDGSGNCYYVGKNGGSGFDLSANQTLYYKGDAKNFPVYINNQTDNGNRGTDKSGLGWYDYYNNSSIAKTPSFIGVSPASITYNMNYAVISPNDPTWATNGSTALCKQKKFANNNNIYWDGVSNTNQC